MPATRRGFDDLKPPRSVGSDLPRSHSPDVFSDSDPDNENEISRLKQALNNERVRNSYTMTEIKGLERELGSARGQMVGMREEIESLRAQLSSSHRLNDEIKGPKGGFGEEAITRLTSLNKAILETAGLLANMIAPKGLVNINVPIEASCPRDHSAFQSVNATCGPYMTIILAAKFIVVPDRSWTVDVAFLQFLMQSVLTNWCFFKITGSWEMVDHDVPDWDTTIKEICSFFQLGIEQQPEILQFVRLVITSGQNHDYKNLLITVLKTMQLLELFGWSLGSSEVEEELMGILPPILKSTQELKSQLVKGDVLSLFEISAIQDGVTFTQGQMEIVRGQGATTGTSSAGKLEEPGDRVAGTVALGLKRLAVKRVHDVPQIVAEPLRLPHVLLTSSIKEWLSPVDNVVDPPQETDNYMLDGRDSAAWTIPPHPCL